MLNKRESYYHWEMMIQSQLEVEVEEDKRVKSPRKTPIIDSPNLGEATADPHHQILKLNRSIRISSQQEEENRRSNDYYQKKIKK